MLMTTSHRGVTVPRILYGTAWKQDATEALTRDALDAGFRGIDTANQRKHYFEAGVGAAVAHVLANGLSRAELFLQTKFTYVRGQDHRLPYDPNAPFRDQVAQSFASSLEHLQTDYVDAYLLHGPWGPHRLTATDGEVWRAMEELAATGRAKLLGVSNVSLPQLEELVTFAAIPPAFVQNRCYARDGWDREVRAFCRQHDILYQGFSLLTANARELDRPAVRLIAERRAATVAQVVFRFALEVGMIPLTGTTQIGHMQEDLGASAVALSAEEVATLERIGG